MTQQIEQIPTGQLIPYAKNARSHPERQIQQIAAAIREVGFRNPILIDDQNNILAGHGRLAAAQLLKMESVPCLRFSDMTPQQKKAYTILDNRIAESSSWDMELLRLDVMDLRDQDFDLDLLGFDSLELANLFKDEMNSISNEDKEKEWENMPHYEDADPAFRKITISFDSQQDVDNFFALIDQPYTNATKSIWFPHKEIQKSNETWAVDDVDEK